MVDNVTVSNQYLEVVTEDGPSTVAVSNQYVELLNVQDSPSTTISNLYCEVLVSVQVKKRKSNPIVIRVQSIV